MRGRRPTPTAIHELRGTLRTRHRKKREPVSKGELTSRPPDGLSQQLAEAWRYAVKHAPRGVLKPIDKTMLLTWIIAEDQLWRAMQQQALIDAGAAEPFVERDAKNRPIPSPYIGIIHKASLRLAKLATELGFSPAARPRLAAGVAPDDDEDDPNNPWQKLRLIHNRSD